MTTGRQGAKVRLILSAVIALAVLLLVIGGVVVVVLAIRQGRLDTSPRALLRLYLYALAFASFLVFLFGATSLVKAGLATVAGRSFSYYQVTYAYGPQGAPPYKSGIAPGPPPVPTDQSERPYRDDLVRAVFLVWCCFVGTHLSFSLMPSSSTSACSRPLHNRRLGYGESS